MTLSEMLAELLRLEHEAGEAARRDGRGSRAEQLTHYYRGARACLMNANLLLQAETLDAELDHDD